MPADAVPITSVRQGTQGPPDEPLLVVDGLCTHLKTPQGLARVVDQVSFSLARKRVLAVVGESGSGKSMLARSIMGLVPEPPGIRAGGRVLFGGDAPRAAAGATVSFVLWFNFLAGFCYVAAAVGLWFRQRWAVVLSALIVLTTLIVFAAFGFHVFNGGEFESRTVAAMIFRVLVWAGIAWVGLARVKGTR